MGKKSDVTMECYCCKKEFSEDDLDIVDEKLVCKKCNHLPKEHKDES